MVDGELFWCFILTPFSPTFKTPFEVIKGFTLREAKNDANELGRILSYLKLINAFHGPKASFDGSLGNFDIYEDYENKRERIVVANEELASKVKEFEPWLIGVFRDKPPSDMDWIKYIDTSWKFWILETLPDPDYKKLELLRKAFMVSDSGLVIGAFIGDIGTVDYLIRNNELYNEYPLKLFYKGEKLSWKDYELSISPLDMKQIERNYKLLDELDKERYSFILRAIEDYENLLTVSRKSSLLLVGLFSVLELLLTHDDKNPGASRISWQLQKKISLLNNQFDEKIDFPKHFSCDKNTNDETIIEALYKRRSIIAHGNQGKHSRDLQIISKGDEVSFLRLLIRKVISFALENPQLILDLKEC